MKASIRHLLSAPSPKCNPNGTTTRVSLKDRILNSTAPLRSDGDHNNGQDDDLLPGHANANMHIQGGNGSTSNGNVNGSGSSSSSSSNSNSNHAKGGGGDDHSHNHDVHYSLNRNISILEVHPIEPILCYVDYNFDYSNHRSDAASASASASANTSTGRNNASSSKTKKHTRNNSGGGNSNFNVNSNSQRKNTNTNSKIRSPMEQQIIIQNYMHNRIISQISLLDIVQQWIASNEILSNVDIREAKDALSGEGEIDSKLKGSQGEGGGDVDGDGDGDGDSDSDGRKREQRRQEKRREEAAILHQTCVNLGFITSVQFIDRQVLYYNSKRSSFSTPIASSSSGKETTSGDSRAHAHAHAHARSSINSDMGLGLDKDSDRNGMPYLILKFTKGILIYKHNHPTVYPYPNTHLTNAHAFLPPSPPVSVMDITQAKLNNAIPTSKPLPIASTQLLAIGCSDGAVRFYSLRDRKVVKSVRGPNGRMDPVVCVLGVGSWRNDVHGDGTSGGASANGFAMNGYGNKSGSVDPRTVRIATICASGTAYVWELQVEFNEMSVYQHASNTIPGTGDEVNGNGTPKANATSLKRKNLSHLHSFKIRSPLLKLDLYQSIQQHLSLSSSFNASSVSESGYATGRDKFKVTHDPDHDLLYWTIQFGGGSRMATSISSGSGVGSSSHLAAGKTIVAVWEWNEEALYRASREAAVSSSQSEQRGAGNEKDQQKKETPVYQPSTMMLIPSLDTLQASRSAVGGGIHGHASPVYPSIKNIYPGLVHPSFSNSGIMSLVVSKEGDLHVVGAGRNNQGNGNSRGKGAAVSKTCKVEEVAGYHTFALQALQKSARDESIGILKFVLNDKSRTRIKITSVTVSRSRPDWVILATNIGILVVNLVFDEEMLLTGSHHVMFPMGRGNGLVSIEGSSVYGSMLVDPLVSSGILHSGALSSLRPSVPISSSSGRMLQNGKVLVYESPQPLHTSNYFQSRPVRIPPRLLLSPSGKYLCLFWHAENRYEILHMGSLADTIRKPNRDTKTSGFSPAVDSGCDVLSFAWVGNQDSFALLCPPEMIKDDNTKKVKMRSSVGVLGGMNTVLNENKVDDNIHYDPAKFKPRVELKVLVGVNADAVEFSVSIAAATAIFLGSISLRGRHAPTCLFGGPILCVGSFTQDKDTSQRDGMSYFYCLRPNAEDNRASSYTSVGPALPYPDMVVWDDDGGLCAMVVGRRIAIYRADAQHFILLGTGCLGTKGDLDPRVQSVKFVHGVLYCTTEKSVQCIFLGNLYNESEVCETDTFTLASIDSPLLSASPRSITPTQIQMSLLWPSILGYHQGVLLVSSTHGLFGVSMNQSILRIGALLSAGQIGKAQKWIESIHPSKHEHLAHFLSRRGAADLAIQLPGLSIETIVDLCVRYGFSEHLEILKNQYKIDGDKVSTLSCGRGQAVGGVSITGR